MTVLCQDGIFPVQDLPGNSRKKCQVMQDWQSRCLPQPLLWTSWIFFTRSNEEPFGDISCNIYSFSWWDLNNRDILHRSFITAVYLHLTLFRHVTEPYCHFPILCSWTWDFPVCVNHRDDEEVEVAYLQLWFFQWYSVNSEPFHLSSLNAHCNTCATKQGKLK